MGCRDMLCCSFQRSLGSAEICTREWMPLGYCKFSSRFRFRRVGIERGSACLLGDIRRSIFIGGIDVSFRFRTLQNNQLFRKVASVETSTVVVSFCSYHEFVLFVVDDDYVCFDLSSVLPFHSIPFQLGFFFPAKKKSLRKREQPGSRLKFKHRPEAKIELKFLSFLQKTAQKGVGEKGAWKGEINKRRPQKAPSGRRGPFGMADATLT